MNFVNQRLVSFSQIGGWRARLQYVLMNDAHTERLLLNEKTPGFLAPRGEEFNPGPEMSLGRSELLCNKVLLKYKGGRESF